MLASQPTIPPTINQMMMPISPLAVVRRTGTGAWPAFNAARREARVERGQCCCLRFGLVQGK
ncbi:hypothetical protein CKY51_19400 [Xanthomonas maliensis]|nr:hypothetical protein CKY51_19400 [Xanthomonas maliensis]